MFPFDCQKTWVGQSEQKFLERNKFGFPGNSSHLATFASSPLKPDECHDIHQVSMATGSDELAKGMLSET